MSDLRPVSIVKVISPVRFLASWATVSPTSNFQTFREFDEALNSYCSAVCFSSEARHIPSTEQIVIIRHPSNRRWYRAQVNVVTERIAGLEVFVLLLDIAEELNVPLHWVRDIPTKFLEFPFRTCLLNLPGLTPCSVIVERDLSTAFRQVNEWDPAALIFVRNQIATSCASVTVLSSTDDVNVNVELHLTSGNNELKVCLNDVLTQNHYAVKDDYNDDSCSVASSSRLSTKQVGALSDELFKLQMEAKLKCQMLEHDEVLLDGYEKDACGVTRGSLNITPERQIVTPLPRLERLVNVAEDYRNKPGHVFDVLDDNGPDLRLTPKRHSPSSNSNDRQISGNHSCRTSTLRDAVKQFDDPPPLELITNEHHDNQKGSVACLTFDNRDRDSHSGSRSFTPSNMRRPTPSSCKDKEPSTFHASPPPRSGSMASIIGPFDSIPSMDHERTHSGENRIPHVENKQFSGSGASASRNSGQLCPIKTVSRSRMLSASPAQSCRSSNDRCNDQLAPNDSVRNSFPENIRSCPDISVPTGSIRISNTTTTPLRNPYYINLSSSNPLDILDKSFDKRRILVCGQFPTNPFNTVADVPFNNFIKLRMNNLGIYYPSPIQKYVWSAIIRGRNVAAISEPHSGKTMAYLLPLISNIKDGSMYSDIPLNNEPLILILCPTWCKAAKVYDAATHIMAPLNSTKVILLLGGCNDSAQNVNLLNGCDILVSTPCALLKILKEPDSIKLTGFSRLCHLVLEDADILTDIFKAQITELLLIYTKEAKSCSWDSTRFQIITFSTTWTESLKSFILATLSSPLLFCSAFFESLIYAGVCAVAHTYKEHERLQNVVDEIIEPYLVKNNGKLIICTERTHQALQLHSVVNALPSCKNLRMVHHRMNEPELMGVKHWWIHSHKSRCSTVLIATDDSLKALQIDDADCLVNYDMPQSNKSQFGRRFVCFLKHMSKPEVVQTRDRNSLLSSPPLCVAHFIVTDKRIYQAHFIYTLVKRLNGTIPKTLIALVLSFYQRKEEEKAPISLCYNLKAFGKCAKQYECTDRHLLLPTVDAPSTVFQRGSQVRFDVTCVRNASHFYGRIMYLKGDDGRWTRQDDVFSILVTDMAKYYAIPTNRKPITHPKLGDMCAVAIDSDFCRAYILYKESIRPKDGVRERQVLFVDNGNYEFIEESKVLYLPDEFAKVPRQAYEIFLCNIGPIYKDSEWTVEACQFVKSRIFKKEMMGKIQLSLGNTLWLNPLARITKLTLGNEYVREFELRSDLLSNGYAMELPDHMTNFERFCREVFDLPALVEITSNATHTAMKDIRDELNNKAVSFAFLPINELIEISISTIIHPWHFYVIVNQEASLDCLDELNMTIHNYVKKCSSRGLPEVIEGMYCLAPKTGNADYARARVINNAGDRLTVFFVDVGDTREVKPTDLVTIPNKFLWKLPLQAIECRLFGVRPHDGSEMWSQGAVKTMRDMCQDADGNYLLMEIFAKKKLTKHCETQGNSYSVEVFQLSSNYQIADELLIYNHASEVEEEDNGSSAEIVLANLMLRDRAYDIDVSSESTSVVSIESEKGIDEQPQTLKNLEHFTNNIPQMENHVKTPLVKWSERKNELFLKLIIVDVMEHKLDVSGVTIKYSATTKEMKYVLELQLYDEVGDNFKLDKWEQCVHVVLKKKSPGRWPRLVSTQKKLPYVKGDLDNLIDSSDEERETLSTDWRADMKTPNPTRSYCINTPEPGPGYTTNYEKDNETSSDDEFRGIGMESDPDDAASFL